MRPDATTDGLAAGPLERVASDVLAAAQATATDHAPIRLRVGARRIAVRFDGPASTGAVLPAWRSLLSDDHDSPVDAELFVVTSDRSGRPPLAALAERPGRTRPGIVALGTEQLELAYGADAGSLALWDANSRRGVWWMRSAEAITVADRVRPLGPVLRWLLRSMELSLVDGAVVGSARGGLLVTGPAGAGRTSTTLAARRAGLAALADDVTAVDPAALRAYPVTGFATVDTRTLRLLPELVGRLAQLPPTHDGKQAVFLDSRPLRETDDGMPLRAIVIPTVAKTTGAPVAVDDAEAARLLDATALRPSAAAPAAADMRCEGLRALPLFTLQVGPEPDAVAAALVKVLRELD